MSEETSVQASKENSSLTEISISIIEALGGEANIEHVTACATRYGCLYQIVIKLIRKV